MTASGSLGDLCRYALDYEEGRYADDPVRLGTVFRGYARIQRTPTLARTINLVRSLGIKIEAVDYLKTGGTNMTANGYWYIHYSAKDRLEGFVVDRIRDSILTGDNLEKLVRMTNEKLAQTYTGEREKLELLETQIAEADSRLSKLYDALETGEFKGGELALRIQALFQKKEEMEPAKAESEEILRYQAVDIADKRVVMEYVDDLKDLLEKSSVICIMSMRILLRIGL